MFNREIFHVILLLNHIYNVLTFSFQPNAGTKTFSLLISDDTILMYVTRMKVKMFHFIEYLY